MKIKDIELDVHTHTIASGHAYGTMESMICSAQKKHLKILGISEHAPGIPGTCNPFYFCNFEVVPRQYEDLRLLLGCEINILKDGQLSLEEKYIAKLDYAIAGIHTQCYIDAGIKKNTENVITAMKHPKVSIIAHPDNSQTPLDYEEIVQAAREYQAILEMNNNSLRHPERRENCIENYKTMLKLCEKYKVPVILSSDAHHPCDVGVIDGIAKFFEAVEFPEELIINYNPDQFLKLCVK